MNPNGGFTTVLTPNTKVASGVAGARDEADFNSRQEGSSATLPTYAAVTARSYHTGVVNVALMDELLPTIADVMGGTAVGAALTKAERRRRSEE